MRLALGCDGVLSLVKNKLQLERQSQSTERAEDKISERKQQCLQEVLYLDGTALR
jgi:hypothetical protein